MINKVIAEETDDRRHAAVIKVSFDLIPRKIFIVCNISGSIIFQQSNSNLATLSQIS